MQEPRPTDDLGSKRRSPGSGLASLAVALVVTAACHSELRPPTVLVGLDRLTENVTAVDGKRIGLIVHRASVTFDGRHAIDVVRDEGFDVIRLFTPEHGLRGQAAAGEKVDSSIDAQSGLPIVSLYGEHRQPRPADLEDLDVLIFDLQGAGVRFYTYVSTLILCLEAAAEAGLELIVLDRPNPLGGLLVTGPVATRETVPESFVNLAPGPLVHGLTLGEMARHVNSRLETPARLTVIPMEGWERRMTWSDTGREWIPPSPNLRSPDAALAYPGIALLEATNVSEGRGTNAPFLFLGAPWLSPEDVDEIQRDVRVSGFELTATRFTPRSSPAAPRPKYLDQECHGLQVTVIDPTTVQPYRLGLELLRVLARHPELEWQRDGAALTWLLGTERVLDKLQTKTEIGEILANDEADHADWRLQRRAALLY